MNQKAEESLRGLLARDNCTLVELYNNCYKSVEIYIVAHGGEDEIAKDIFHDSLEVLINNLCRSGYTISCKVATYLFQICKNKWNNEQRRKYSQNIIFFDIYTCCHDEFDFQWDDSDRIELFINCFSELDIESKELLNLHFSKVDLNTISKELNIPDKKEVSRKIYRCKEKLIKRIKSCEEYKITRTQ